jgi:hypothetical protein
VHWVDIDEFGDNKAIAEEIFGILQSGTMSIKGCD